MKRTMKKTSSTIGDASAKRALRIAAEHCLLNYPTLYTAGLPQRGPQENTWTVPIEIVEPDVGAVVGTVGELAIDARTGQVIGGTPKREVLSAGKALARANFNGAKTSAASPATKAR